MEKKRHNLQLFRFCLYGFLKNQLYFEPFLILAFLEKELNFLEIGFLVSFRAISVNFLEIPSGAAADVWGRRRSMIVSMLGYIASFVIFALAERYWVFFPAMLMFAVGEAFRTGTHKAMIFDWLSHCGREEEKTKIYGFTRSWSKVGSAISVIIAAIIVISTNSYIWVFWISIIPYLLNVVNFIFYPSFLDGQYEKPRNMHEVISTLRSGIQLCFEKNKLRNLIIENVCFEGFYSSAKEYLQPLLKVAALAAPVMLSLSEKHRTAILVAIVYAILNLMSSFASRKSHKIVEWAGNEFKLSGWILAIVLTVYGISWVGMNSEISILPVIGFVLLSIFLNIWKPVFVSRFYELGEKNTASTTLSIANQSKTLSVVVVAPILGWSVDRITYSSSLLQALWPVAVFGIGFSILGLIFHHIQFANNGERGQFFSQRSK